MSFQPALMADSPAQQTTHVARRQRQEVGVLVGKRQVIAVAHRRIGRQCRIDSSAPGHINKGAPVLVIDKNGLAAVVPCSHMVAGTGKLESQWTDHVWGPKSGLGENGVGIEFVRGNSELIVTRTGSDVGVALMRSKVKA